MPLTVACNENGQAAMVAVEVVVVVSVVEAVVVLVLVLVVVVVVVVEVVVVVVLVVVIVVVAVEEVVVDVVTSNLILELPWPPAVTGKQAGSSTMRSVGEVSALTKTSRGSISLTLT